MLLGLGFASAGLVVVDVYGRGHRQRMAVMEAVWPVNALYFGPVGLWAYRRFGRPASPRWLRERGLDSPTYWMLMQVGMIVGFATAWPANVWLLRRGSKEPM